MNKKRTYGGILSFFVLGLFTAAVYGAFSDSISVTNFLSMGDVNISLKEYEIGENGMEITYQNEKIISPGEELSKIPRITNTGEPCYVRARILYENSYNGVEGFSDRNLKGISKEWKKQGEYYYYTQILDTKNSVDLFQKVVVPKEWTEEHSGQRLKIIVEADAIQAVHFLPDFNAASPWNNIPVETCIHEADGEEIKIRKQVELSVKLEGEACRLVAAPDDFFSNFSVLMPGDHVSDAVMIQNQSQNDAELFFRTESEEMSKEEKEFLEKIKMTISYGDEILYSGNILAESLNQEISLGMYSAGESGRMQFELAIPEELNNVYAKRQGKVKWIFRIAGEENLQNKDKQSGSIQGGSSASGSTGGKEKINSVNTGDSSGIYAWMVLFGVCGIIVGTIVWHRKGGKRFEKDK